MHETVPGRVGNRFPLAWVFNIVVKVWCKVITQYPFVKWHFIYKWYYPRVKKYALIGQNSLIGATEPTIARTWDLFGMMMFL
jgi:hypothetical protein